MNLLDQVLRVVSALVVAPIIIHALGIETYGVWILALSIAGYVELLDLGYSVATVRFGSKALGEGCAKDLEGLFKTIHAYYCRLGWYVCVAAAMVGGYGWYQGSSVKETSSTALVLAGLLLAWGVTLQFRSYASWLKIKLEYGKLVGVGVLRLLLFTVLVGAWKAASLNLWTVLALHSGLQVLEGLVTYAVGRPWPVSRAGAPLEKAKKAEFKANAREYALMSFTQALRQRVDTQLLASFSTMTSVSQYAVGVRLPGLFFEILNAMFGQHLMAAFTRKIAQGNREALTVDFLRVLRLSSGLAILGGVALYVFGPVFIECWLGTGFTPAHSVLQICTVGITILALNFPSFALVGAVNAYGKVMRLSWWTAGLNFVVSLVLVQKMGLQGVVWGTMIEQSVWGIVLWPMIAVRDAHVPLAAYLRAVLFRGLPLALCVVLLALEVREHLGGPSFLQLAWSGLAYGAVGLGAYWFLILQSQERAALWRLFYKRTAALIGPRPTA